MVVPPKLMLVFMLAMVGLLASCDASCETTEVDLHIEAPAAIYAEMSIWEVQLSDAEGVPVETLSYQSPEQVGSSFVVRLKPRGGDASRGWQAVARGFSSQGVLIAEAALEGRYEAGQCVTRTISLQRTCPGGGACDSDSGAPDAGPDATHDAELPRGAFSAPQIVAELPEADDPTLTGDMLEIYFEPHPPNGEGIGYQIWRATRDNVNDPWGEAESVPELDLGMPSTVPEVSYDGLSIFVSYGSDNASLDIYRATRTSRHVPFSTPQRIAQLASEEIEAGPVTDELGTTLVMHRNSSARQFELIQFVRTSQSADWQLDRMLDELNSDRQDLGAFLWNGGRVIYFESSRPSGTGQVDIYTAERSTPRGTFANVRQVTELNSSDDDSDFWLSPDGRTAYFVSDRGGPSRIYRATR